MHHGISSQAQVILAANPHIAVLPVIGPYSQSILVSDLFNSIDQNTIRG
uniref:Uncharacterized protein n=1 Tax=Candidatus Methanogaster sp. ANME-2c ERB4 TaxID=2759911 RepID=A0A7G9YB79_9EURY|nr:hypothetical protein CDIKLKGH_00004 [Methanosarcinales archaeon ANME-2c ERB4]